MPRATISRSRHDTRFWLRYVVPPGEIERGRRELMDLWNRREIDGVLLFASHAEEWSPGLATLGETRKWLDDVRPILDDLDSAGVPWGINIWQTIGFSRFAPGLRRAVPYQQMVGHDGTVVEEWGCPLDERFINHVVDMYATLAEVKPRTLWIDDDFRYFGRGPAALVCFCPLHLKAMQQRVGRSFTRKSLLKALGDPDHEHGRIRRAWLKNQYESLANLAEKIRRRVAQVSPSTKVCLMTGGMEHRAVDGWEWKDLTKRLWPRGKIRIRPGFGFYSGGDPRPYLMGTVMPRHQQALLPPDAELWPEIENYPGGHFSRPATTIQQHILIASFFGMGADVTLSILGFLGQPLHEVEPIFDHIRAIRPMLAPLNEAVSRFPQEAGLRMIAHEQVARYQDWRSSIPWHWPIQRPYDSLLPVLGFAMTFRPAQPSVSVASSAALARALGPKRIAELMRDGLYVDGGFARAMSQMHGLPIRPQVDTQIPACMEEVTDAAFGGRVGDRVSLRLATQVYRIDPERGRVVSWCLGRSGRRVTPGTVVYDAGRAGRLAVSAIDMQALTEMGTFFRSFARKQQLHRTFNWLGRVPLFVRDHPDVYPLARCRGGRWLIGMTNLRADPWPRVEFELSASRAPARAELLHQDGTWKSVRMKTSRGKNQTIVASLPAVPRDLPMSVWRLT